MKQTPILIEQTDKRYKVLMLIGGIVFVLGLVAGGLAVSNTALTTYIGDMVLLKTAGALTLTGIGVHVLGRVFAWWDHG